MLVKWGTFLVWSVVILGTLALAQPKDGGILFGDFFDRDELVAGAKLSISKLAT